MTVSAGKHAGELAAAVLEAARAKGATLGTAESCTGGLVAAALTDVAGSSDVFKGGVVSYWEQVKTALLGVDEAVIAEHGVVSSEVAAAMANGAAEALGCDYAISTTGIAGPGGAEPGKPVGTVWFGMRTPEETRTFTTCKGSTRAEVREQAVESALQALLDALA